MASERALLRTSATVLAKTRILSARAAPATGSGRSGMSTLLLPATRRGCVVTAAGLCSARPAPLSFSFSSAWHVARRAWRVASHHDSTTFSLGARHHGGVDLTAGRIVATRHGECAFYGATPPCPSSSSPPADPFCLTWDRLYRITSPSPPANRPQAVSPCFP